LCKKEKQAPRAIESHLERHPEKKDTKTEVILTEGLRKVSTSEYEEWPLSIPVRKQKKKMAISSR